MPKTRIPEYLTSHVLAGDRIVLALDREEGELARGLHGHGRRAVTLVKEGGLTVVLLAMEAGNTLAEHAAVGPTTVLVLRGILHVNLGDEAFVLRQHEMIAFAPNVRHDVRAEEDSTLLISVVMEIHGDERPTH